MSAARFPHRRSASRRLGSGRAQRGRVPLLRRAALGSPRQGRATVATVRLASKAPRSTRQSLPLAPRSTGELQRPARLLAPFWSHVHERPPRSAPPVPLGPLRAMRPPERSGSVPSRSAASRWAGRVPDGAAPTGAAEAPPAAPPALRAMTARSRKARRAVSPRPRVQEARPMRARHRPPRRLPRAQADELRFAFAGVRGRAERGGAPRGPEPAPLSAWAQKRLAATRPDRHVPASGTSQPSARRRSVARWISLQT